MSIDSKKLKDLSKKRLHKVKFSIIAGEVKVSNTAPIMATKGFSAQNPELVKQVNAITADLVKKLGRKDKMNLLITVDLFNDKTINFNIKGSSFFNLCKPFLVNEGKYRTITEDNLNKALDLFFQEQEVLLELKNNLETEKILHITKITDEEKISKKKQVISSLRSSNIKLVGTNA